MRLTAKLTIVVFVVVAALILIASSISLRFQLSDIEDRHRQLAEKLAAVVPHPLPTDGIDRTNERPSSAENIVQWQVASFNIRFVEPDAGAGAPESPVVPRQSKLAVVERRITTITARDANGGAWLHTYIPVVTPEGQQKALEISESLQPLFDAQRRTLWTALATLAGIALACVGVVFVGGMRLVGRPLERLIEKTTRIGTGDFSGPLPPRANDELGRLTIAINQMCDKLSQQRTQLNEEAAARAAVTDQLRHADRLKTVGRLAAGLAHEIGTPLNVVSGRAALIASDQLDRAETKSSAEAIKHEADRIAAIIRQLLDFARRTPTHKVLTDIDTLCHTVVSLLDPIARKNGIALRHVRATPPIAIHVDPPQIQQVVTNIVMNAIHASPANTSIDISLSWTTATAPGQEGKQLRCASIAITDHGPGIPSHVAEHIFEPFYTTKDVGEGTGLGLSIAYGIVEDHDGWIDLATQEGEGSTFTVYLPEGRPT
ncbi:MAG: HAMP domain-containing sensor histidine kinase [Pirellulaceae bacterium]|nr:HAMP domain-containing histidine kinase [Planctomycetales bacterium]